jgi:hypothetical protein
LLARTRQSAQHGQRQLVFGVLLVVLAVDRDLLAVFEKFAGDDPLVFNFASDAVGSKKIDRSSGPWRGYYFTHMGNSLSPSVISTLASQCWSSRSLSGNIEALLLIANDDLAAICLQ